MRITQVERGSIAQELGIEPDDVLMSINGSTPRDVFDYRFLLDDEYVELCVIKPDGQEYIYEVEKYADEDIGLIFETALMDKVSHCRNKCIFCFIDQLPQGMRGSLYFKDDDMRLSFLQGNYVTLTNISDGEFERLVSYHLSPINISVHATDPDLRSHIMRNPRAARLTHYLNRLRDARIQMNFQIVLMKGVNDGVHLDDTIRVLGGYIPFARSLSVVPVGLTRHRDGLPELQAFTKEDAANVLAQVDGWNRVFAREHGTAFVFAADEFYLKAESGLPSYGYYEDFPQIENGVGMLVSLRDEFMEAMGSCSGHSLACRKLCLVTGKAAHGFIAGLANAAAKKFGLDIRTVCVDNKLFGDEVTVSGLLSGRDIQRRLLGLPREELGECILLPSSMFRSGTDTFLDDTTASQLGQSLGVPVKIVETQGKSFLKALVSRGYVYSLTGKTALGCEDFCRNTRRDERREPLGFISEE